MDILAVVPLGSDLIDQKLCDLSKYISGPSQEPGALLFLPSSWPACFPATLSCSLCFFIQLLVLFKTLLLHRFYSLRACGVVSYRELCMVLYINTDY